MFGKLDVRRKSLVTVALSQDNRKTVVRYFVNPALGFQVEVETYINSSLETELKTFGPETETETSGLEVNLGPD